MRKLLSGRKRKIVAVIVLAFLAAACLEIFIPTGFRFDYLVKENYQERQEQTFTLADFTPEGCEIEGEHIVTKTTDAFLVKNSLLDMRVTQVHILFEKPIEKKSRIVIYYTIGQEEDFNDKQSIQYYVFPEDTEVKIDMGDAMIQKVRIDLSDEPEQSMDIQEIGFQYIPPLQVCAETFSIARLLMFWAILALIPIGLLGISKP